MRFTPRYVTFAVLGLIHALGIGVVMADESPSIPDNAVVRLTTDRDTYFLGENVLIHFELVNSGGDTFQAGFGHDYRGAMRALRYRVTGTDEDGKALADPYPSTNCFGGMGGEVEVTPEKPCLLYTSPSPRDATLSRMPSSA